MTHEHHAPDAQPEDVNPLGHHARSPQERRVLRILTLGLVASVIAIPIIAVLAYAPVVNVLVGLLPLLATLGFGIVMIQNHYRHVVLLHALVFFHVVGLAVLWLLNFTLATQINVSNAVVLSFLVSVVIVGIALLGSGKERHVRVVHEHHVAVPEFHEEKLAEYVQSIEDKVKGLNFAIGRVYRRSNGANDAMRERLRISREWYNEFYEIKPVDLDAQKKKAKILIHKIHDRLKLLANKENAVFSEAEVKNLKNLARNRQGEDAIIDVLKTNDRDPVEHYYVSALQVCDAILKGLEK